MLVLLFGKAIGRGHLLRRCVVQIDRQRRFFYLLHLDHLISVLILFHIREQTADIRQFPIHILRIDPALFRDRRAVILLRPRIEQRKHSARSRGNCRRTGKITEKQLCAGRIAISFVDDRVRLGRKLRIELRRIIVRGESQRCDTIPGHHVLLIRHRIIDKFITRVGVHIVAFL